MAWVAKAKTGELHLNRTIRGLRSAGGNRQRTTYDIGKLMHYPVPFFWKDRLNPMGCGVGVRRAREGCGLSNAGGEADFDRRRAAVERAVYPWLTDNCGWR